MYMLSLPKFRPHGLIILSHMNFTEYVDMLYSQFPPTNIYLHPDYFILLILCLLGLICCILSECMLVHNKHNLNYISVLS